MSKKDNKKMKLELEYALRSSPQILYQYISTPSGLQIWFADHVDIMGGGEYRFAWDDGTAYRAKMIKSTTNKLTRFELIDQDGDYLEFKIVQDDITGDVELIITEFVEEEEAEMAASIWDSAIDTLCSTIGA
ncbi:MAG: START-like domain-containing protein [Bacteroidia bacterium]|jgi:uncharacterized protein YndB with AHSA1/START domain|nr:START-like domain-containing protein [Bacteroidia bacterium]